MEGTPEMVPPNDVSNICHGPALIEQLIVIATPLAGLNRPSGAKLTDAATADPSVWGELIRVGPGIQIGARALTCPATNTALARATLSFVTPSQAAPYRRISPSP
jgi:hypothetical protein